MQVFSIVPLSVTEWCLVLLFAFPVILIDEVLKFIGELRLSSGKSSQVSPFTCKADQAVGAPNPAAMRSSKCLLLVLHLSPVAISADVSRPRATLQGGALSATRFLMMKSSRATSTPSELTTMITCASQKCFIRKKQWIFHTASGEIELGPKILCTGSGSGSGRDLDHKRVQSFRSGASHPVAITLISLPWSEDCRDMAEVESYQPETSGRGSISMVQLNGGHAGLNDDFFASYLDAQEVPWFQRQHANSLGPRLQHAPAAQGHIEEHQGRQQERYMHQSQG